METGILKQVDLLTAVERYFFVEAQRTADQIKIRSVQAFKPLELTFRVSDLRVSHNQASTARGGKKYEFKDDTGGLLTQLKIWVN
ncbi:hypothetical protein [Lactiplantibacillus modestisalitolerans]|uniref:Uncharacterized protein n=1 Tax=Lactiplantibacillus modestisalitolerans TaxID=1457219 RepID=A0ABV5WU42_9LACO|nr:hypothetical protein [Lactiplantibacillus modestisalitolerans]